MLNLTLYQMSYSRVRVGSAVLDTSKIFARAPECENRKISLVRRTARHGHDPVMTALCLQHNTVVSGVTWNRTEVVCV